MSNFEMAPQKNLNFFFNEKSFNIKNMLQAKLQIHSLSKICVTEKSSRQKQNQKLNENLMSLGL